MPQLHFHVDNHDVGYMSDPDNVATYLAIDDAVDDAISRAEQWLDDAAIIANEDPEMPTRGQPFVKEPHTYALEVKVVEEQIEETQEKLRTNEEAMTDIAKEGLLFVLENGLSVIEVTPCSEDACEAYREDWIE